MQVREVMTKYMDFMPLSTTLEKAAKEMKEHDFGFLPIGENGKISGIVTDRDIAVRGIAEGLSPSSQVDKIMTKTVMSVHEDDDVRSAAELMEQKKIRRLVVLDASDHLTGVLSLGDIACKCGNELCGEIIKAVSEKTH